MKTFFILFLFLLSFISIGYSQTAKEFYNSGLAKYNLKDYSGAVSDCNKAIEINPQYGLAYFLRGKIKTTIQDYKYAIKNLNQAIEIDPKHADSYYFRGIAKNELGQKDCGCQDLRKALDLGYTDASKSIKMYCSNLLDTKPVSSKKTLNNQLNHDTIANKILGEEKTVDIPKCNNLNAKVGYFDQFVAEEKNPRTSPVNTGTDNIDNYIDSIANQIYGEEKPKATVTNYQNDKIKVGNTFIDLPIPNGFIKVDKGMGILLETAKTFCPETNTLLAYYISEADYADFLVNQNHLIKKYILIEVFNEAKYISFNRKQYRQILKDFKNKYIEDNKEVFEKSNMKTSQILSNLEVDIKIKDVNSQPLGICYESENSISQGLLAKYDFIIEDENLNEFIIAGVYTITKIQKKSIFLYVYQIYNSKEDINSVYTLNTSWVKEIEKRQTPISIFNDFDYKNYLEIILSILSLSIIWAIYFATKKIHKKIKNKNISDSEISEYENIVPITETNEPEIEIINSVCEEQESAVEYLDFKSYLDQPEVQRKVLEDETSNSIDSVNDTKSVSKSLSKSRNINPIYKRLFADSRKGILIFCVLHFIFEIIVGNKNMIWPVLINYLISDWYVRTEIKKNKVYKIQWLHGIVVAFIVFLIRVVIGAIFSIITENIGAK